MESTIDEYLPLAISDREPIHWAFRELAIPIVNALLKEIGVTETLELIRPRARYSGRAMARNFATQLGLESGSIEAIIFTLFCGRCLTGGKGKITLYEHGAVVEIIVCPWIHGPPKICIMTSHYISEGACEEINPEFEVLFTHHLTQGDASCIGICKRKGDPNLDPGKLGAELKVIDHLDIDEKEREAVSVNLDVHLLNNFLEGFLTAAPADKVLQLLDSTFKDMGNEAGRRLSSRLNETDSSIGIGSILSTWGEMLGNGHEVKEIDEGGSELTVPSCILCHSPLPVCKLMESFLAGMISALDEKANVRFIKCSPSQIGCKIIVRPQSSKHETASAPLVTLKMRFAKGELSEDEYRRMRAILLEK